jgi:hypothetical protein
MKNFMDYFFGTISVIFVSICLIFLASLGASGVVMGFQLLPVYMQIPCVCVLIIGVVLLISITVFSICTCKKYVKIIKQIDRNPNTPPAADQVEDYSFKSLIKEIV